MAANGKRLGFLPGWRIMTYVVLGFNLLMLLWIVGGVSDASDNCVDEIGTAKDACEAGTAVGAGIGAFLLFVLWVFGDIILGVIWLVTNKKKRQCPVCGHDVKKGEVVCRTCGFDFRYGAMPQQPLAPAQWQAGPPQQ